jgi:hypothetical protein
VTFDDLHIAGGAVLALITSTGVLYRVLRKRRDVIGELISQAARRDVIGELISQAAHDQWQKEATRKELKFDHKQRITATEHRALRLLMAHKIPAPPDLKFRVAAALRATQGAASA